MLLCRFGLGWFSRLRAGRGIGLDVGRGAVVIVPIVLFGMMVPVSQIGEVLLELLLVHPQRVSDSHAGVCMWDHSERDDRSIERGACYRKIHAKANLYDVRRMRSRISLRTTEGRRSEIR